MSDQGTINYTDYKNTFFNILNFLASPISMFFAIPIFIFYLGIEKFGIWILINSIIGSLRFIDAGLGSAIIKFVSKYKGKDDILNINKIINNSFLIFSLIITFTLLISLLTLRFDSFILFFNIHADNLQIIRQAMFYSVILLCIKLFENLILSVFKAYERFDYFAFFSVISRVFLILTQIVTVIYLPSLSEVFFYSCYTAFIIVIIELFFLKNVFKNFTFSIKLINLKTIKEIYSFGLWSWALNCVSIFQRHIDKLIVIKLTDPTILGYYSIAFFIFENIHSFLSTSVSWLFPKISRLSEQKINIKNIYYKSQFALTTVGIIVALFIYSFDEFILTLWLDYQTYLNVYLYVKLFLVVNLLYIITISPFYFLNAMGFIKTNTVFQIYGVSLTIIFMFILYPFFGIYGIILARCLNPFIIGSIARNYVNIKCLNNPSNKFYGFQMLIPLLLIILGVVFYEFKIINYTYSTLSTVLFLISYYFIYYKKLKHV